MKKLLSLILILGFIFSTLNCSKDNEVTLTNANNIKISSNNTKKSAVSKNNKVGSFVITKISKKHGYYEAEINNELVIKHIAVEDNQVILPARKSKSGRTHAFIKTQSQDSDFLLETLKSLVLKADEGTKLKLKNENVESNFVLEDVNVSLYTKNPDSSIKGFADVSFDNGITLSGYVIRVTRDGLVVSWPSYKVGRKFYNAITMSKKMMSVIDEKILSNFKKSAEAENFSYSYKPRKNSRYSRRNTSSASSSYNNRKNKTYDAINLTSMEKQEDGTYNITLNKSLLIKNVRIKNNKVIFPFRTSKSGKTYSFITEDKKNADALKSIIDDILNKKISKKSGKLEMSFLKGGKYPKIGFNNTIAISNFYLNTRKNIVSWPSIKNKNGKFDKVIILLDKDLKKEIDKKILSKANSGNRRYNSKRRYYKKRSRSRYDD